jgi:hypothetical protein
MRTVDFEKLNLVKNVGTIIDRKITIGLPFFLKLALFY